MLKPIELVNQLEVCLDLLLDVVAELCQVEVELTNILEQDQQSLVCLVLVEVEGRNEDAVGEAVGEGVHLGVQNYYVLVHPPTLSGEYLDVLDHEVPVFRGALVFY